MDDAVRIALESGLPYTGLRDFHVDPKLWHYVPLTLAARERIVPVTLIGNRLQLAAPTAEPDLSSLLSHFPNLEVDVLIAPAAEIDAALARAQEPEPA